MSFYQFYYIYLHLFTGRMAFFNKSVTTSKVTPTTRLKTSSRGLRWCWPTPASSTSSGSTPSVRMTPSVRAAGVIAPISPISVYRPRTLHISTAGRYGPSLISLAHICNTDYRSYHSCQATKLKYRHHDYWWMCQNIPSKKCYPFESWIGEHFHAGSMILAEKANIMLKISLLQSSTSCNHYPCYIGCCWLDRFVWT